MLAGMRRLTCLDGLRGVLACYVMLSHTLPFAPLPRWLHWLFQHGGAGVDVFFILSGLVIVQSLASFSYRPLPFLIARVTRIYPVFLVVFGFAVAVHPADPLTAWFVPAIKDERRVPVEGKVVVARTRDGGRTFELLRQGLPQDNAYDLVFRHALDVDATGERLAFGSTTGSLWVTENGGEAWSTVSEHLPPVHAVSFRPAKIPAPSQITEIGP